MDGETSIREWFGWLKESRALILEEILGLLFNRINLSTFVIVKQRRKIEYLTRGREPVRFSNGNNMVEKEEEERSAYRQTNTEIKTLAVTLEKMD